MDIQERIYLFIYCFFQWALISHILQLETAGKTETANKFLKSKLSGEFVGVQTMMMRECLCVCVCLSGASLDRKEEEEEPRRSRWRAQRNSSLFTLGEVSSFNFATSGLADSSCIMYGEEVEY